MLLLSGSVGSYVPDIEDDTAFFGTLVCPGAQGFVSRLLLAYSSSAFLLLLVAFVPDLDDPFAPNPTVQLGSAFEVLWLLMSLRSVGVVQRFLRTHSSVFQALRVGRLVVMTQGQLQVFPAIVDLGAAQ